MKRFVFAAWAAFLGAIVTLTLFGLLHRAPEPEPTERAEAPRATFTGSDGCIGCHRDIDRVYRQTRHPLMLGPVSAITAELLDQWHRLPDGYGNPVMFEAHRDSGVDGIRDLVLADGTRLNGIAAVHIDHDGDHDFTAYFRDTDGRIVHRQSVSPYPIGSGYRQALAVNLGDGAGTRLLKYQYGFNDGTDQHGWHDRGETGIYEANCIGCHVSGFDLQAFEADRNRSLEELTADLGVGCESCHGPGNRHVAAPRAANRIVNPARLSPDQQNHICAQCHIRGTSTMHDGRRDNIDFRPGDNILDHFRPVPVDWGRNTDWVAADGKASAGNQQFMDHYLGTKADLTCTDCHAVHSDDSHGRLLRSDLLQICADCHGETAYPDLDTVRHAMDGRRNWDDPGWQGWRSQHTFRLDQAQRVIGLPASDWPVDGGWPWDQPNWHWDFPE